jgi:hypothetical protein
LEYETFVKKMHGKNQDVVCHVTKNKHGDECMQNLKEKEDFGSKKGLGGPNLCLFEQKLS